MHVFNDGAKPYAIIKYIRGKYYLSAFLCQSKILNCFVSLFVVLPNVRKTVKFRFKPISERNIKILNMT